MRHKVIIHGRIQKNRKFLGLRQKIIFDIMKKIYFAGRENCKFGGRVMNLKRKGLHIRAGLKRQIAVVLAASLLVQGTVVQASFDSQSGDSVQTEETVLAVSDNQLTENAVIPEEDGLTTEETAVEGNVSEETSVVDETEVSEENVAETTGEGEILKEGSVSANMAGAEQELVKVESPFEEDRYNPIYYGEVVERWPEREPSTSLYMTASQEKSFEQYILNAISNFEVIVDVSAYNISVDDMWTEIYHVLNAHPELYYVTVTSAYYNRFTYTASNYVFTYMGTKDTIETEKAKFNAEVDKALAYVDSANMSDYEQALAIHDYIILNCEYDEENYSNGMSSGTVHTAYGAMVDKIAVCDGYAKAYQYIMSVKLGIPCLVVTSSSMGHAWSLIQIDGKWYHTDLTWDDPVYDCIGRVTHDFFLLSDSVIGDYYHEHYDWQVKDQNKQDILATSTKYDNYSWIDISSGMFKIDDYWYYTSKEMVGNANIIKDPDLSVANDETILYSIPHESNVAWTNLQNGCLARLMPYESRLYFNTPSVIKSIAMDGTDEKTEYVPNKAANQFVYGFVIQNGNMKYAVRNNTGTATRQEVCTVGVGSTSILSLVAKDYNSLDVTLNKTAKAPNATSSGYIIYRKLPTDTNWQTAAILEGENNCFYRDGGLNDSTTYTYTARNYQVINGDKCYGPYGNIVSATTMAPAPAPEPVTTPQKPTDENNKAVKGKTYKVGNFKYKVTAVANGNTGKVTLVAPVKKTYTKVTIPSTVKIKNESYQVTAIGKNAFKNNKKLKTVVIGKNVTTIGATAFYGCKKLKTVTVKTTKLKSVGKNSFKGIYKSATIKVPKKKYTTYKKMLKKKAVALPSKTKIKKY